MRAQLAIGSCLSLAILCLILPTPMWVNWIRPEFPLLVLIYWSMAAPQQCGVLIAAITGLVCDVLTGTILGQHMAAYAFTTSITALLYKRLRTLDVWHQAWFVFLLVGLEQMFEHWLATLFGRSSPGLWFMLPVLISSLIWPAFMIAMRAFRRRIGLVKHWV